MEDDDFSLIELLRVLRTRGALNSVQLQSELGVSQPTVSRLVAAAATRVLVLGQGRATRYALPHPIGTAAAVQPLWWIDEAGIARPFARLSFAERGQVHVEAALPSGRFAITTAGRLPWLLAPLRGEGFLGRALARRLAPQGLPAEPGAWSLEQVLLAALHTPDAPGALVLGEPAPPGGPALEGPSLEGVADTQALALLEQLADGVAQAAPAGSSAGGEQPKFLLRDHDGHPLIVKFSPPRGSPFGERWHDLLHAEALALALLGEHGVPVAAARVVHTPRRTLLLSRRFDRIGRHGRRHAVPLWAVHEAFVPGAPSRWATTCEALEARRRLPAGSAVQVQALAQFGRLIGNTDMHFGNLSLFVAPADVQRGRFTVAPLYDMLPMRWRPDPASGELGLLAFSPDPADLESAARPLAAAFWRRLLDSRDIGRAFRTLAATQHGRTRA